MFKKIMILLVFLCLNLFGETLKWKTSDIDVSLEENNDAKIFINCSDLPPFEFLYSSKDEIISKVCEEKKIKKSIFEITSEDFIKIIKSHYKNNLISYGLSKKYLTYNNLKDLNNNNNNMLDYYINLKDVNRLIYFDVSSLNNTKLIFSFNYYINNNGGDGYVKTKEEYIIKNYKYDFTNKKIEKFELNNDFLDIDSKTFTNDYDIDNNTECINGYLWVKKYGQNSGRCKWIEKK